MAIFFTSDLHFGHQRIIDLAYRPFDDADHMNRAIIDNYNAVVSEDDICYFLGDICMGGWKNTLPLVGELNGTKFLVRGNHEKFFADKNEERKNRVMDEYRKYFDDIIDGNSAFYTTDFTGLPRVTLSHFPANEDDSQQDARYMEHRPRDNGGIVIHGHVHSKDTVTVTKNNTIQYHVGVDAHSYTPVALDKIVNEVCEAYDSIPH